MNPQNLPRTFSLSSSRVDIVSVLAGIVFTLACMFFCMSLAAALGFWSYRPDELPLLGPSFWTVASAGWTLSVFMGCLITAVSSRSQEIKNGILNALVTWAGGYLLFGGIALTIADSNLRVLLGSSNVGLFWHGFIGDAIALSAGLAGGILGTYIERGSPYSQSAEETESSYSSPDRMLNFLR